MIKSADDIQNDSNDVIDKAIECLNELKAENIAVAVTLQVHLLNGKFLRYKDLTQGSNMLAVLGALECAKEDLAKYIMEHDLC